MSSMSDDDDMHHHSNLSANSRIQLSSSSLPTSQEVKDAMMDDDSHKHTHSSSNSVSSPSSTSSSSSQPSSNNIHSVTFAPHIRQPIPSQPTINQSNSRLGLPNTVLPLPISPPPFPIPPSAFSSPPSSSPPTQVSDTSIAARVSAFRAACLDSLSGHQTHNLIPHSSKVVIFDSKLKVQHAFDGLVTHDINCAPVWDSSRRKYIGMLSVSDFLDILLSTSHAEDTTAFLHLSQQRLCDWNDYQKRRGASINRLLCISPESTLHEAVRQLLNYRVHRLCVVQLALADTILRIITNHGILRFLRQSTPLLSSVTIRDLGIGVFKNLLTLTYNTPIRTAMELLSSYKVSSIPVVDSRGVPVDIYSRSDVRYLAMDNSWTNLDMTVEQALSQHQQGRVLPICTRDDNIMTVSGLLVSSMKHSLICVHPDTGVIEGVVSLTDVFAFLLSSGPPRAESRIAALRADYEANENGSSRLADPEIAELARRGLNVPVSSGINSRIQGLHSLSNVSTVVSVDEGDEKMDSDISVSGAGGGGSGGPTGNSIAPDEDWLR